VNLPPYSGMTSCGNSPIFKDGKGCGSCYQIKCKAPQDVSIPHSGVSNGVFAQMMMDCIGSDRRRARH
jgi:hypothetical protein